LHEGCQNPATRSTGRILAKRAPLGAPSPSVTPEANQMLANWEELTNPYLVASSDRVAPQDRCESANCQLL